MIRLFTDASFIVRGKHAQIGLAVTVRDDARVVSRITQAYTDPAITENKTISGENHQIAELRACLLGFEHLASLKAQGWVWQCGRVDYTTDNAWVASKLNRLRQGCYDPNGEAGVILACLQEVWRRAGVVEVRVFRQSEAVSAEIRDCDTRSKRARNVLVDGVEQMPSAKKTHVHKNKQKKNQWRKGR